MNSIYEQMMTVLYSVWRKRWYGLVAMWAVCLVGWFVVGMIPNQYESDARIYVKWNSILPDKLDFNENDKLRQIDIVRQTLTSRPNLEKVVRRTELADKIENDKDLDILISDMLENITVKSQQDNLFTLSYISKDSDFNDEQNADLARRVVQNLINIFVEDNISSDRDSLNQAIRFMEDQISQRGRELEEAERRRAEFEQHYLGQLPGDGSVTERLTVAQRELSQVEQELIQAQSSLRALSAQLSSTPSTIAAPSIVFQAPGGFVGTRYDPGTARGRIEMFQRQISDAYARGWTDAHPDVVAARAQIKRLEAEAAREARSSDSGHQMSAAQPNPVYVNLRSLLFDKQSAVAALSARRTQLQNDIADLQAKQIQEPGIAAEQAKLNRDYNVLKAQYDRLLRSREEIRLRSDVENKTDQVRFQIVEPPSEPRIPVAPNRPILLSGVLLAGIAAGIAVAFLMSQLHTTYATVARMQHDFSLPVLGSVSQIVSSQERAQNRLWLWGFMVLSLGLIGTYGALLLYELIRHGIVA